VLRKKELRVGPIHLRPRIVIEVAAGLKNATVLSHTLQRKADSPLREYSRSGDFVKEPFLNLMRVSVIIPTLNELTLLPATVAILEKCVALHEIIIADGGSTDGTCEWVEERSHHQKTMRLLRCERGRGKQLNAGASAAEGEALFFLHADCLPAPQALDAIVDTLQTTQICGGCFYIGFSKKESTPSLQLVSRAINFRSRIARTATGDQGIFARRTAYEHIGGFKSWPLFEDVDFATRLKSRGKFVVLEPALIISARRWKTGGVWRTTTVMGLLLLGYHLKIPPARLKRWFADMTPATPKRLS
jgi:rSAM/selenodomain-associated transferase 2